MSTRTLLPKPAVLAGVFTALATLASHGAAPAPVFEKDIRPILKTHCFHCHGEDGEKKGDIDLRQRRLMLETGALKKNDLPHSEILKQIRSGDMPKKGKPLSDTEIALIERWLAAGAPTARPEPETVPEHFITEEERAHWSFQPVVKPSVPRNRERHPIDAFVAAQLTTQGLKFAPAADRATLLRRASFDLLGLPPTPEEIQRFVADRSTNAWGNALDRMLASPHYGERWGRHWLDVAGYADSNGGGKDSPRDHAWHFRDYVVKALNENKPWDAFIQEQLAGDELARLTHERGTNGIADPTLWDTIAATGFLRMAPDGTDDDPPDATIAREAVVAENLKVLGSSLLGLTIGCAQCHDHRFDPISHTDYYRLRALVEPVFNPDDWRGPKKRLYEAYTADERAANDAVETRAAVEVRKADDLIDAEYLKHLEERLQPVPESTRESVRAAWLTEPKKRTDEQKALLKQHNCDFEKAAHLRFLPNSEEKEKQRVAWLDEAKKIRETKLSRMLMAATEVGGTVPVTKRFHRGDYRQPKEAVAPGEIAVIENAPVIAGTNSECASTGRRLSYARWLTSGRHPLVARVLVNRFWYHHFGRGLVMPLADLGMRTPRPVQGDLLDWLAADFMENGWDLKAFHKRVMTSRTYQQGNRNPAAETKDSENIYLARAPLKRLEAEAVRDSLLAVAGNLNEALGGKPALVARRPEGGVVLGKELSNESNGVVHTVVPLGDAAFRRSIYVQNRRNFPLSVLQAFDMPQMTPNCAQRPITTVAPQSLMMLNDGFVIDQSRVLARRLLAAHPGDTAAQVRALWERAYLAKPTKAELGDAVALVAGEVPRQLEQGAKSEEADERAVAALCQVVFASNRFLYAP